MTAPIRVAVTGAGGQIGYALIFRIAAGDLFGPTQPVSLRLLEIPQALPALQGTLMELDDCACQIQIDAKAGGLPAWEATYSNGWSRDQVRPSVRSGKL